jgi:hypothetical protein
LAWKEKDGVPVLAPRKKKSLVDLAIEHELADPDSVHEILECAYGKMRKKLRDSGFVHKINNEKIDLQKMNDEKRQCFNASLDKKLV